MTNKRVFGTATSAAVMVLFLITFAGCQKEGPAERAGKEVDKATTAVGQQIEKAGEKVQDATRK